MTVTASIFNARKRSWGKEIFLHLSVSYSVHRGDVADTPLGRHTNLPLLGQATPPMGRYTCPYGHTCPRADPRKTPLADPCQETATEVGGMKPTGMHSCLETRHSNQCRLMPPFVTSIWLMTLPFCQENVPFVSSPYKWILIFLICSCLCYFYIEYTQKPKKYYVKTVRNYLLEFGLFYM